MWPEGQCWDKRGQGGREGAHRNLKAFAHRGGSRIRVLMVKPYSLGCAPLHPISMCSRPTGVRASLSPPGWAVLLGTGSLVPGSHRPQEGKQSLRSDSIPLPGLCPEQSLHLQLDALGRVARAVYDSGERIFLKSRSPFLSYVKATWGF